jgi:hypothetical protein
MMTNDVSDDEVLSELLEPIEMLLKCSLLNQMLQLGAPESYKFEIKA